MVTNSDSNYEVFRDCLSTTVIDKATSKNAAQTRKRASKGRKNRRTTSVQGGEPGEPSEDPAELADFIDYLATEIFTSLPSNVQDLSYHFVQKDASLAEMYSEPLSQTTVDSLVSTIPPDVANTLISYSFFTPPSSDLQSFMSVILACYISTVTAQPPAWLSTRASACEICERDWVPLTYHHLIPKGVHAKVLKRGWHEEHMLNSVAWLCRACHSFVHKIASNEELALEWYTVERICTRNDVKKWATWVAGVRWKKR